MHQVDDITRILENCTPSSKGSDTFFYKAPMVPLSLLQRLWKPECTLQVGLHPLSTGLLIDGSRVCTLLVQDGQPVFKTLCTEGKHGATLSLMEILPLLRQDQLKEVLHEDSRWRTWTCWRRIPGPRDQHGHPQDLSDHVRYDARVRTGVQASTTHGRVQLAGTAAIVGRPGGCADELFMVRTNDHRLLMVAGKGMDSLIEDTAPQSETLRCRWRMVDPDLMRQMDSYTARFVFFVYRNGDHEATVPREQLDCTLAEVDTTGARGLVRRVATQSEIWKVMAWGRRGRNKKTSLPYGVYACAGKYSVKFREHPQTGKLVTFAQFANSRCASRMVAAMEIDFIATPKDKIVDAIGLRQRLEREALAETLKHYTPKGIIVNPPQEPRFQEITNQCKRIKTR